MSKNDIFARRERLRRIGEELSFRQLSVEDKTFLSEALIRISNGEQPEAALDIERRAGESNGAKARDARDRRILATQTIIARRNAGESLDSIVADLGENGKHIFNYTEETLRTYAKDKG